MVKDSVQFSLIVILVNNTIQEVKSEYTPLVYSPEFLKTAKDTDLTFTIEEDLLLEMILFKIRSKTIKFASHFKKSKNKVEEDLIKQIENAEKEEAQILPTEDIDSLKKQLIELREAKLKGQMIRSRIQWLHLGEKPSQYFCKLEQKNYTEKTIKKIVLDNGEIVTDQPKILQKVKEFYAGLFRNTDFKLTEVKLCDQFKDFSINKLSVPQAQGLEGQITLSELANALKKMKNNKTPGIDGFPSEFFKMFWNQLKFLILKTFNLFFKKGTMSVTLRQAVISCIPKGDKPRHFLKNWRPISLLCVLYKLLSSVIANRLKTVLDHLISRSQSGFIQGRQISEVTRLIYDIMNYTEKNKIDGLLMLIDFEKAFDSISWKFMYNVLEYLGFTPNFINWIKLLNNNIQATVIQAGCKSEFFKIEKGCKQGDPIAAYLFILCAQILTYMINQNDKIKGLKIDKEIKLCQFADDTTLILDGTKESLIASLNTIEVFGSYSGLKMNTTKTKLIWIGRKKYSKEKINISTKLQWGTTIFNLLGITFSVNLDDIPSLNYSTTIEKSKKLLNHWKGRILTPLGKINVIKTFILSQFIHLFTSIPSPSQEFIKTMNSLFFNFIWNNKPDKVKRIYITQDYQNAGLRMVNLKNFISALKISWINKLLTGNKTDYILLFEKTVSPISKFFKFGSAWPKLLAQKTSNIFWKEVLLSWEKFVAMDVSNDNNDIMTSPLWYNALISKNPLYIPTWYNKGVVTVGDIIDITGCVLELKDLERKFNISKINFLEYYRVRQSINTFLKVYKNGNTFSPQPQPYIIRTVHFLVLNKHGTRGIYNKLNKISTEMDFQRKWLQELDLDLNRYFWQQKFRICFKTIQDPNLIWFQYRILHRILGTQSILYKMGISNTFTCLLCESEEETLYHLFCHCHHSKQLWNQLENLIVNKVSFHIKFDHKDILLGYSHQSPYSMALNTIIMVTKKYIFSTSRKHHQLNIEDLFTLLKKTYEEQKTVKSLEMQSAKFEKAWMQFKKIFSNNTCA